MEWVIEIQEKDIHGGKSWKKVCSVLEGEPFPVLILQGLSFRSTPVRIRQMMIYNEWVLSGMDDFNSWKDEQKEAKLT